MEINAEAHGLKLKSFARSCKSNSGSHKTFARYRKNTSLFFPHFFPPCPLQGSIGLQSCIWTKNSGSRSFRQARPKWRCLSITHSPIFVEHISQHIGTNASYQLAPQWWRGDNLGTLQSLSGPQTPLYTKLSVRQLKSGPNQIIKQENDPKNCSKSTELTWNTVVGP